MSVSKRKIETTYSALLLGRSNVNPVGTVLGSRANPNNLEVFAPAGSAQNIAIKRWVKGSRLKDRKENFLFAASYLWVMNGSRQPEQVIRPLKRLERRGIEVVIGTVETIEPVASN